MEGRPSLFVPDVKMSEVNLPAEVQPERESQTVGARSIKKIKKAYAPSFWVWIYRLKPSLSVIDFSGVFIFIFFAMVAFGGITNPAFS